MFSALTNEFRTLLEQILENQTVMGEEMKDQNERLEEMNKKINKMHEKLMAAMKALHVAYEQIKTVAEHVDDTMCEGLGRMSRVGIEDSFM